MSGSNRPLLIDALLILTLLRFLCPPIVFVFYRWNFVVERFFNQFSISYVPTWWSVVGFGCVRWTWSDLATEIWKGLHFTDKIVNTSSVGLSKVTTTFLIDSLFSTIPMNLVVANCPGCLRQTRPTIPTSFVSWNGITCTSRSTQPSFPWWSIKHLKWQVRSSMVAI